MAESIVSFAAQRIESKIKQRSKAIENVKSDANDLILELTGVNKLYIGAEGGTHLSKIPMVRIWAEKMRRIAYQAEDEVDKLESGATPLQLLYHRLCPHRASKNLRRLKEATKEVKQKLDEHAKRSTAEVMLRARGLQAPMGHLRADGDFVIGIDDEIRKVVDQLTGKSEFNHRKLAIVGMGGSGKTTLARSVYNHKTIKKHFYFQAWVSVTLRPDPSAVLLDVYKELRRQKRKFHWRNNDDDGLENESSQKLVSRLNDSLKKKNCLLVLDDVWNMESLHELTRLIEGVDFHGTYTIVITSRQSPKSDVIWHIHKPRCLTDEDSWTLFSMVASNSSKPLDSEYQPLGMQMLRKCQGLPLAIVALGRLLKTKDSIQEWHRVLSQIDGAEATSMYGPVNEILGLSYDDLPQHLKPCFLYVGLFPEGSVISGGVLIRMWIAEGFISCDDEETPKETPKETLEDAEGFVSCDDEETLEETPKETRKETLEDIGRRYLQELVDQTMVEVVSKTFFDRIKTIRIHSIMRDFCILKARELDFLTESSSAPEFDENTSRRAAINLSDSSTRPVNNSLLRSLVLFEKSSTKAVYERHTSQANQRPVNMSLVCQKYILLRVLDIFGIKSPDGTMPKDIGSLIHLTYLRIRSTNIRELPKSIGKLHNLLTLDYWDVSVDTEIDVPNVLWKLKKLRHLFLPIEMSGSVEDLKLHTLKNLVTLWGVGGGNWMLKEMGGLRAKLSKLFIHRISTESQLQAVLDCLAKAKNRNLYALALDWYNFEFNILHELRTHTNLKKLKLTGKAPDKSQDQEELKFPSNLGKLELCYTQLETSKTMASLGRLASLKVLQLSKDSFIGAEWHCSKTAFPVLVELKLTNLSKLKKWVMEEGAMPLLRKLSIISCNELEQLPEGLKLIQSLEKLEIERMPYEFISRLQKEMESKEETEGEDFHIIEHIPRVRIRHSYSSKFYQKRDLKGT